MEAQGEVKAQDQAAVSGPSTQSKAHQAERLAQRLAAGDGRLALLLTQMADALASLIDKSQEATAQNANQDGEEQEPIAMGDYEDLLQDWLASVHDIQLTLRKAIRFLVLAQHPPVLTASHALVAGGGSNAAKAGRAAMPAHLADLRQPQQPTSKSDGDKAANGAEGEESEDLSLSAMRVQHRAWKDLLITLESLKAQQDEREASGQTKWPASLLEELIPVHR